MNRQQWQSSTAGRKDLAQAIPLSFAIPATYTATASGGPILVDSSTVRYQMQPPLIIPEGCCATLHSASFAFTQPNIADPGILASVPAGNNRITIQVGGANPWIDIVLDTGLYDYNDVQTALNIYVRTHDVDGLTVGAPIVSGSVDLFLLTGISATQKLVISLNPAGLAGAVFPVGGFSVSFENPSPSGDAAHTADSIGEILGYPTTGVGSLFTAPAGSADIYSSYAPNIADFGFTSAYALYMSIVTNSYQNGQTGQLLYSFSIGNETPNSIVEHQATLPYQVPVTSGSYSTVDIWTADQSGNRLPLAYYQAPFTFQAMISKSRKDGSM